MLWGVFFFGGGGVADLPVRGIPGLFEQRGEVGKIGHVNLWRICGYFPRRWPVFTRDPGHWPQCLQEDVGRIQGAFASSVLVAVNGCCYLLMFVLHPWKSTRNLKITSLKRKFIFQTSMFGFNMLIFQVYIFWLSSSPPNISWPCLGTIRYYQIID